MDWLVYVLPQRWLICLCEQAEAWNAVVGGLDELNRVVSISAGVAVKYGYGVMPGEAATQHYAYQHLDRRSVRVPRVYRFFQDRSDPSWPKGYLFMEYIPGKTLEDLEVSVDGVHERLANIVSELATVMGGDIPGQVDDCMLQGYMLGDNGTRDIFRSIDDMNWWLNKQLQLIDKTIDLRPYPLVLCHLDLCRRNIMRMDDNTISLLDWGHAGFFPRFFEVAAVSCINGDLGYGDSLHEAIMKQATLTEGSTNV